MNQYDTVHANLKWQNWMPSYQCEILNAEEEEKKKELSGIICKLQVWNMIIKGIIDEFNEWYVAFTWYILFNKLVQTEIFSKKWNNNKIRLGSVMFEVSNLGLGQLCKALHVRYTESLQVHSNNQQ